MKPKLYIGIDPGVKTGIAIWDTEKQKFQAIKTCGFWEAHEVINSLIGNSMQLIIEDPRKVRFKTDPARAQGAGSVKRDASLWEELCVHLGVSYILLRPNKTLTKWSAEKFKRVTGWKGRTSSHARDAAMLVFQR